MTITAETSTAVGAAGSPPAGRALRCLPRLATGGVERGTVEVAQALIAAGWKAWSPPPAARWCASSSAPAPSTSSCRWRRRTRGSCGATSMARSISSGASRSTSSMRAAARRHGARSAATRRTGRHFVTTFHNAYGTSSLAQAALQRGHGARRAGHRHLATSSPSTARVYGVAGERLRMIERGVDLAFDPERVSAARMPASPANGDCPTACRW